MDFENIKADILEIYPKWKALGSTYDDEKYSEIYEGCVRDLIISYCESKGYEVEGYPFQKRILGATEEYYDEDYFCYERNLKYLDVLASTHDDVFEILYFYSKTFWPDQVGSQDEYRNYILENIKSNSYDIEF